MIKFSLLLMPCVLLNAVVLYSQIPDTLNVSGYRCQLDSVLPMEADIVDDIVPMVGGWQIDSIIAWFCNWGGFATWDSVPNIHFIVYEDSSGQPVDSPMVEIVVDQSDYTVYYINGPDPSRWRVEMRLPTSVILDTMRYWIEIQPSNSTFANGNTGNQAQEGIGNGQAFYMKFPLAGVHNWESATALFGEALETGFILIGDEFGVSDRSIKEPLDPYIGPTIIHGSLDLPQGRTCRVYDITGRLILADELHPGIYFIEIDGEIAGKVIKIR